MQIVNKKAKANYRIIETIEAGIKLGGAEVKSVRQRRVSIDSSHVAITSAHGSLQARLIGMHAAPYLPAGRPQVDPGRSRRLLLHKNEILRLADRARSGGFTLIPLRIYDKHGWIKIEVALVRGKKQWEKRETLKKRDVQREIERSAKFLGS